MKLKDIILSNHWLSVKLTLVSLFPDQEDMMEDYELVYNGLQLAEPVENDMLIVLTEYDSDGDYEESEVHTYVDVSGRKAAPEKDAITYGYALEYTPWKEWLGMNMAPETMRSFNELEIISHCLNEMTCCGFDEVEIQKQINDITKLRDDYFEDKKRKSKE